MTKDNVERSNQSDQIGPIERGYIERDSIKSLAGIVILAGGNSRRMGTPKARLTLPNNERLLDYHVRQALRLSGSDLGVSSIDIPIMIADNERDFTVDAALLSSADQSQTPLFHIEDYQSELGANTLESQDDEIGGPLVAIESALQAVAKINVDNKSKNDTNDKQSAWLMVISCDSLISAYDLWQALGSYTMTKTDDKAVICLTDASHLYPLLGLYNLSIEPKLQAYIDSGKREVMAFINPITQAVPVAKEWQPLTNLNTPDDFKRACSALTDL